MYNLSKTKEQIKGLLIGFVLVIGMSYVSAWTGPSVAPTGGNKPEPINKGTDAQVKSGSLGVTVFNADAASINTLTGITSPKYCIGTNCITSWNGTGGVIYQGTCRTVIGALAEPGGTTMCATNEYMAGLNFTWVGGTLSGINLRCCKSF